MSRPSAVAPVARGMRGATFDIARDRLLLVFLWPTQSIRTRKQARLFPDMVYLRTAQLSRTIMRAIGRAIGGSVLAPARPTLQWEAPGRLGEWAASINYLYTVYGWPCDSQAAQTPLILGMGAADCTTPCMERDIRVDESGKAECHITIETTSLDACSVDRGWIDLLDSDGTRKPRVVERDGDQVRLCDALRRRRTRRHARPALSALASGLPRTAVFLAAAMLRSLKIQPVVDHRAVLEHDFRFVTARRPRGNLHRPARLPRKEKLRLRNFRWRTSGIDLIVFQCWVPSDFAALRSRRLRVSHTDVPVQRADVRAQVR